jgi:hypothetical protein
MENYDRNIIQLSFLILRNQLSTYVQNELISFYGVDWINSLRNDPLVDRLLVDEIYNEKLFYKNADIRNVLLVYSHQWERIFKKMCNNDYPLHLCEVIQYYYGQYVYEFKFNYRETYKIVEMIQSFMEEINFNVNEINMIRNDMLLFLANDTFNLTNISNAIVYQLNNPNSNTIQIYKMYLG